MLDPIIISYKLTACQLFSTLDYLQYPVNTTYNKVYFRSWGNNGLVRIKICSIQNNHTKIG